MKTPQALERTAPTVYTCELATCPRCGGPLALWPYQSGRKTVQTLTAVQTIAQRPKRCADPQCPGRPQVWKSAQWLQIAPWYGTYGYDVIAQIGWQRQTQCARFAAIHRTLRAQVQISESQVRYLYHQQYLPLLACHERRQLAHLRQVADQVGLILTLDGLAPEGGEPQLWVVRELQTGLTLRCGWLSQQDQATFVNFLTPIRDAGLRVAVVLSDKERGLAPAVPAVFPAAKQAFCQLHYFQNLATPVAEADQTMKVTLRQTIRATVGDLIRQDRAAEAPGVLTVTGLLPSPVPSGPPEPPPALAPAAPAPGAPQDDAAPAPHPGPTAPAPPTPALVAPAPGVPQDDAAPAPHPGPTAPPAPVGAEQEAIVQDLLRRVRYLLTLKGRPPFRLAGLEMVARLTEVTTVLERMIQHQPDARLVRLRQGVARGLAAVHAEYTVLRLAGDWVAHVADLLDPQDQPARSGATVRQELWAYLDRLPTECGDSPVLQQVCATMRTVSRSYDPGLFHTYDLPGVPRTNNERESEFRDLTRRLLTTTGQNGLVRRLIQREGAWELLPHSQTFSDTVAALAQVNTTELRQEQQRVRNHRNRFRLHTRSPKQSQAQLQQLEKRWAALPPASGP